jgi:hypothetical protein
VLQRSLQGIAFAGAVAVTLASDGVFAQPAPCGAWEVEYVLSENLRLSDTPLGAGNGTYAAGPGRTVLRFEDVGGRPGGRVQMLSYDMREHFRVDSKAAFWGAHVTTDVRTRATPDICGASQGVLRGSTLAWTSPLRDSRTDGTLTCDGSACGKFGAPRAGESELHIGPGPVTLAPFEFSSDMKTFTMHEVVTARTEMPKQTTHSAISGREVRRTCVAATTCR